MILIIKKLYLNNKNIQILQLKNIIDNCKLKFKIMVDSMLKLQQMNFNIIISKNNIAFSLLKNKKIKFEFGELILNSTFLLFEKLKSI
jgi:hypothetical protein